MSYVDKRGWHYPDEPNDVSDFWYRWRRSPECWVVQWWDDATHDWVLVREFDSEADCLLYVAEKTAAA